MEEARFASTPLSRAWCSATATAAAAAAASARHSWAIMSARRADWRPNANPLGLTTTNRGRGREPSGAPPIGRAASFSRRASGTEERRVCRASPPPPPPIFLVHIAKGLWRADRLKCA
ncbi:unnamed protein product [Trichogramma brassicae]|uniref:Uncharacterized protein n=1 Tax=Trichogramma brassicae TaxID=86971 RepID=A0A6H5IDE8_9HYME|nr:unnamed protein product [Trichogramma brassicae]